MSWFSWKTVANLFSVDFANCLFYTPWLEVIICVKLTLEFNITHDPPHFCRYNTGCLGLWWMERNPPAWGLGSLPAAVYVMEVLSRPGPACTVWMESSGFLSAGRDRAVHEQAEWKCTRGHLRLTWTSANYSTDWWRQLLSVIQWDSLLGSKRLNCLESEKWGKKRLCNESGLEAAESQIRDSWCLLHGFWKTETFYLLPGNYVYEDKMRILWFSWLNILPATFHLKKQTYLGKTPIFISAVKEFVVQ